MYTGVGPVHGGMAYLVQKALEGDFAPRCMSAVGMSVRDTHPFLTRSAWSDMDPRAAVYVVRAIPALPSPATVMSHYNFRGSQVACSFPHPDPRSNALAQSVAASCEGFRTDLWLYENDLWIGVSGSGGEAASHLRFHLDSLVKQLAPRTSSAGSQITMSAAQKKNPRQTFILVLDAKSRFDEIYPLLVSQLDTLRQRGSLSHWDGTKVIRGPVTIVVTGEPVPSSHCSSYSYADVFWMTSGGDVSWDGVMNDPLTPICAV